SWPAPPPLKAQPDGPITVALRPHHVHPGDADGGVPVRGRVLISEISGSESVVHFDLGGLTWVSLSHGVHGFRVGEVARFALQVERCFYFAPDGARAAT
ncbi:MAG: TOBE domain-containing protein, partial [Burkholderiales bacterium]